MVAADTVDPDLLLPADAGRCDADSIARRTRPRISLPYGFSVIDGVETMGQAKKKPQR